MKTEIASKVQEDALTKIHSEITKISICVRCPLCLSTLLKPIMLDCLHVFCHKCLHEALKKGRKQRCPVCNLKCTKRSIKSADQMEEIITAYQKSKRELGLTPMVYDPDVEMTQLDGGNSQGFESLGTKIGNQEAHKKLKASKMWESQFKSKDEISMVSKQEKVVASNTRTVKNIPLDIHNNELDMALKGNAEKNVTVNNEKEKATEKNKENILAKPMNGTKFSMSIYDENVARGKNNQQVKEISAESPVPFATGTIVNVASRTWSGINKEGGVAKIISVNQNDILTYDVKYVLGGTEKNVEASFVKIQYWDEHIHQDNCEQAPNDHDISNNTTKLQSDMISKDKENANSWQVLPSQRSRRKSKDSRNKRATPFGNTVVTTIPSSLNNSNGVCSFALARYKNIFTSCMQKGKAIHLVLSTVNQNVLDQVQDLISNLGKSKVILQNQINHKTTVCVTVPSHDKPFRAHFRTLKIMRAALLGIPILKPHWITACLDKGTILIPDDQTFLITSLPTKVDSSHFEEHIQYAVTRYAASYPTPPIFQPESFAYLCGKFLHGPKKSDILELLKDCQVTILSSSNAVIKKISQAQFTTLVIYCDESEDSQLQSQLVRSLRNYFNQERKTKLIVVSSFWLFDSISFGEGLWDRVQYYEPKCRHVKEFWRKCI